MHCLSPMDLASCFILTKSIHAAWISFVGHMTSLNMAHLLEKHQDAVMALLRHASRARNVVLTGSHNLVTDKYLKAIKVYLDKMEHLTHVSLSYCTNLTIVELASTTLESVDLIGCDHVTTLHLRCPELLSLDLSWCRLLNADAFVTASRVPLLTRLVLTGWEPSVDVDIALLLLPCPRLTFLDVTHVALSNAGLHVLFSVAMSSLRTVVLSQAQANVWVDGTWSVAELEACRRRRPDIQVLLR
ncbi:hypothetical protein DYB28_004731 [Aphanomyces astaci]|uniref:F-box domain-containing protein n=1 Tax=Aphanomyces astaci TaxID=112090 RepID=A0A9X8DIE0_APHAT|nr:hypothetical protein DYB28_004731 [Aphanomyces astaci]